jgi:hypothetical protein
MRSFADGPKPRLRSQTKRLLLLLFGLLRSGQVRLRRLVGWQDLNTIGGSQAA